MSAYPLSVSLARLDSQHNIASDTYRSFPRWETRTELLVAALKSVDFLAYTLRVFIRTRR
ncbi:hypothetical protein CIP107563_02361 [Corynebacterium diphtheriae]|nr:hypothetical protein CIP107563_02361 [Corynebacterium diphtheriae]